MLESALFFSLSLSHTHSFFYYKYRVFVCLQFIITNVIFQLIIVALVDRVGSSLISFRPGTLYEFHSVHRRE